MPPRRSSAKAAQPSRQRALASIERFSVGTINPDAVTALGLDVSALVAHASGLLRLAGVVVLGPDEPRRGAGHLLFDYLVNHDLAIAVCTLTVADVVASKREPGVDLLARVWTGETSVFVGTRGTDMAEVLAGAMPSLVGEFVDDYRKAILANG
jgi:hypothetical protein